MKTLLLSMLCLFVWNQSTEALTDQQVVLGQNATLSCLFEIKLQACKKRHQQCQDEELEQFFYRNGEEFSEVEFRLFLPTNGIVKIQSK
ncbi:hypothetical protein Q8A67_005777 [Cirrhinus molitorella]|uniref:Secreted protein n=1 Tax=Cirrhinus molitorella TaxID=172907 RepID=A0AA88PZ30_9TELE|nr:hypothetical protein Q8A67_005777 [Cirrhinus molitorella]